MFSNLVSTVPEYQALSGRRTGEWDGPRLPPSGETPQLSKSSIQHRRGRFYDAVEPNKKRANDEETGILSAAVVQLPGSFLSILVPTLRHSLSFLCFTSNVLQRSPHFHLSNHPLRPDNHLLQRKTTPKPLRSLGCDTLCHGSRNKDSISTHGFKIPPRQESR